MDKLQNIKILLVGCGKMGGALLSGWLDQHVLNSNIKVIEPSQGLKDSFYKKGIIFYKSIDDLGNNFDPTFVIFAVKPQIMDNVVPDYDRFSGKSTFISIAAGKTINYFETKLGQNAAIIRAMPNTPAAVKRGTTIACGNSFVTPKAKKICLILLAAVGTASWLEDENLIDAVTAVSGSGPAYVFLLAETMTQAGIESGLDHKLASQLAIQTISGSGEMLVKSVEDASTLRKNVTSPGGTTEAALSILMSKNGMQKFISEAISMAIQRSKDLAD
jgi:pyrroline-5-carboxylate reductase